MKFNLPLHLAEVEREEKESQTSLAAYTAFLRLNVDLHTHMPELTQGAGKTGPPFQTIKHNAALLQKRFPEMRRQFAEVLHPPLRASARRSTSACAR